MKIIGYNYEAEVHCVGCTVSRFHRTLAHGADCPNDEHGVRLDAEDSEGNRICPIFSTDEKLEPQSCGDCGGEL